MTNRNTEIATIIRDQIGHGAFVMMGARQLLAIENGLQFRVGSNPRHVTKIQVVLDPDDTYTVKFWNIHKLKCTELASEEMVYADSLAPIIEQHTGFYLSLGTRRS